MWRSIALFIFRFRILLLTLLIAITVGMGYFSSQIQMSYEFTKAISTDNPKYLEYQQFLKVFGADGNLLTIGFKTDSFFEPKLFNECTDFTKKLEKIKGVENVLAITNVINLYKDSLHEKFIAKPLIIDHQESHDFYQAFKALPFYNNFLFNPQNHAYLFALRINKELLNNKKRNEVVNSITATGKEFEKKTGVAIHYSGLPFIRTVLATQVQKEMKLFILFSFVLTTLILFIFFRSFSNVLVSMLVVAMSVIWSIGIIVLSGYKVSLLTGLVPSLIVVIGIPNCVYFLNRYHFAYQQSGNKKEALIDMVERMGIVTFLTNLTAAIGFGVFYFTKSAVLKEFGWVAGWSLLAVFFISLIFIPIAFSFLKEPKEKHINYLDNKRIRVLLEAIFKWVNNHRFWIYGTTILLSVLAIFGLKRLHNVGYIVDDLPKNEKVYQDLKFFETNFHGVMPLEIVVDSKKKNGAVALPFLEKIDAFQSALTDFSEIGYSLSIANGIKFARQAYYNGDSSSYALPNVFDGSFIQPYLKSKNGTDTANLFSKLVRSFIDSSKTKARISINMADIGSEKLPKLLDSLHQISNEIFDTSRYQTTYTGTSIVFLEGSKFIINSLRDSLIFAFLIIFGCMIIMFRSGRIVSIAIIVNLIPMLFTAGLMGWCGIPLKPSTVLVFSVALGIAVDVTIRFLVSYKQELVNYDYDIAKTVAATIQETGMSIIYTSLILIAGFGVFCLSGFDGTKMLGYLVSATLLVAMVVNLTLLPSLLMWIDKVEQKRK